LIIPFAASVAPKRMFDSTDSETSDDTRKKGNNKGKGSAPLVADEDYGEKQKGQPHRGSERILSFDRGYIRAIRGFRRAILSRAVKQWATERLRQFQRRPFNIASISSAL
jgi:hypothetical protein